MKCYLCGQNRFRILSHKLRYGEQRKVLQCEHCSLTVLEPKQEKLQDYYADDYRKLYTPIIGEATTSRQIFEMYLPFQQRRVQGLKSVISPSMRVLEIGCSAGHFLYSMKPFVKECIGIEFNKKDAEFVNRELGIQTYTDPIERTDISERSFDFIAVLQVLEHMDEPLPFLSTVSRYLKPGGYLCLEVPNVDEALLSVYNIPSYKDFYFKEPHNFYYSPKTLKMLTEKAGFHGEIKSIQRFSLMNHLNWTLTGKPQKRADHAMSAPVLVSAEGVDPALRDELNQWANQIDREYKAILNRHLIGESVWFLGKHSSDGL